MENLKRSLDGTSNQVKELSPGVPNDLLTIKKLVEKHSSFLTEGKIRWLMHKREDWLKDCFFKLGKKVYISESLFLSNYIKKRF